MAVSNNFRSGAVNLTDIRLNSVTVTGQDASENLRKDFGSFPLELALKVCNPDVELTEDEVTEIRATVETGDSDSSNSMLWLVNSIIRNGVKSSIVGYVAGEYLIPVEGNRRTTACYIATRIYGAKIEKVPFKVLEKSELNTRNILLRQFLENQGRKDLDPIEESNLFNRLIKEFGTIEAVSEETGISTIKIEQSLSLLNLSKDAQEVISKGYVKKNPALQAMRDAEKSSSNPLEINQIVSDAIVEAASEAESNGKSKASLSQIKEKLEKQPKEEFEFHPSMLQDLVFNENWNELSAAEMKKVSKLYQQIAGILDKHD